MMNSATAVPIDISSVDLANSDYRQIFCAALQGLCANPNVFGPYNPDGDARDAVRSALACTFYAITGVAMPPVSAAPAVAKDVDDNEIPF